MTLWMEEIWANQMTILCHDLKHLFDFLLTVNPCKTTIYPIYMHIGRNLNVSLQHNYNVMVAQENFYRWLYFCVLIITLEELIKLIYSISMHVLGERSVL